MKTFFSTFMAVSILIYLASCLKEDTSSGSFYTPYTIEVYEFKTGIPVQGASIILNHCTKYDWEFGCMEIGGFATYFTGPDGIATISRNDYSKCDKGMIIEKPGYWSQDATSGRNEINAEGWVEATFKKVHEYPLDKHFFLLDSNENYKSTPGPWNEMIDIFPLHDTTIKFRAFGGQLNHLKWIVGQSYFVFTGFNSGHIDYNAFAESTLAPLSVNKNGVTGISIEY